MQPRSAKTFIILWISFRTPTWFNREELRDDITRDRFEWYLASHRLDHVGCGTFHRTFESSRISVAYEVGQGLANDILTLASKIEDNPEMADDENDSDEGATGYVNKLQWGVYFSSLRNHLAQSEDDNLFIYDVLYVDVPIPILLRIWYDWKTPVKVPWEESMNELHWGWTISWMM